MLKKVSTTAKLFLAISSGLLMAGCGIHSAQPAPGQHHPKPSLASVSSPSPSGGATPSLASVPPSSSPSKSSAPPSQSSSSSAAPSAASSAHVPPPPGAGPYTGLRISVLHATPEGELTLAGRSLNVYLLTLKVDNPTSGMIALALNDLSTMDGTTPYDWNDYTAKGLSGSDSLFSMPLSPATPASDVTQILPGRPLTGDITVLVPPAPFYHLDWNGTETPAGSAASFSS